MLAAQLTMLCILGLLCTMAAQQKIQEGDDSISAIHRISHNSAPVNRNALKQKVAGTSANSRTRRDSIPFRPLEVTRTRTEKRKKNRQNNVNRNPKQSTRNGKNLKFAGLL